MTRAAPFGLNKVVFLSHVVGTNGPVFPREARCRRLAAGSSSGESDPGGSGSLATVFGLIP